MSSASSSTTQDDPFFQNQRSHQRTKDLNSNLKSLFLSFDEFPHFVLPKMHFNALKALFKKDATLVKQAYDACLIYLNRRDSRVRFRCLLFLKQLVARSSKTRAWLESDFNDILEKCIIGEANGGDSQLVNSGTEKKGSKKKIKINAHPWQKKRRSVSTSKFIHVRILPEPAEVAVELRDLALRTVEEWNDVYGALYPKITVGYNYLKNVLLLKFPDVRAENVRMAKEKKEREEYAQRIVQAKYIRVKKEFSDNINDMIITIKEAEEILRMLVPDFDTILQRAFEDPNYRHEDILQFLEQGMTRATEENNPYTTTAHHTMNESSVPLTHALDDNHVNNSGTQITAAEAHLDEEEDEWENVVTETTDATTSAANVDEDDPDNFDLSEFEHILGSVSSAGRDVKVTLKNTIADLKSRENKEIVEALEEKMRELMKTYKPMLDDWYIVISKVSVSDNEKREYDRIYMSIIDLKRKMDAQIRKCTDLKMDLSFPNAKLSTLSGSNTENKVASFYAVPQMSAEEMARKRKRSNPSTHRSSVTTTSSSSQTPPSKRRRTQLI